MNAVRTDIIAVGLCGCVVVVWVAAEWGCRCMVAEYVLVTDEPVTGPGEALFLVPAGGPEPDEDDGEDGEDEDTGEDEDYPPLREVPPGRNPLIPWPDLPVPSSLVTALGLL